MNESTASKQALAANDDAFYYFFFMFVRGILVHPCTRLNVAHE